MKNGLVFLCIVIGIISLKAQKNTYTISGKVIDFHNKIPLKDAKISITENSTFSDEKGRFSIPNLSKGQHLLRVSHPHCEPFEKEINLQGNLSLTVTLEHHGAEIEAIIIEAPHKTTSTSVVSTLGDLEIDRNSAENLGNLLTKLSGVNTLKTGNSIAKPVIRGLYGSRILIYNNSVRLTEQEWGAEHAPNVDPNSFDHLDVIKGANVLKYGGDAIGGVIVLEPKLFAAKDTLIGKTLLTGFSNGKGLAFSTDLAKTWENQWFVRTQGTYKKSGDYSTPDFSLQNTSLDENALNFSFGKRSFKEGIEFYYSGIQQNFGIFRGSHLGYSDDFYQVIKNKKTLYTGNFDYKTENPRQETSHHLAKIEAYKRYPHIGKLTASYNFQINRRKEFDIRIGEYNALPSLDLRLITHQTKIDHLLERSSWNIESGISGSLQDNFANPETKARRLIPDYYRYDLSTFSVFNKKFSPKWWAEIGFRYDVNIYDAYKYYDASEWNSRFADLYPNFVIEESDARVLTRPQFTYHNISGNAGLSFQPNTNTQLKLNFSRANRAPNAAELFANGLHHSASVIERGNLSIEPETVYQVNLEFTKKVNVLEGWSFNVSPYYMTSESFINQIPTELQVTIRGIFPVWDYQQISARLFGLDFDSHLNLTKNLQWQAQFSYVNGEDLSNNEPLILMAPTKIYNGLEWNFSKSKNAYLKVENETVFHQNRYPVRNFDVELIQDNTLVTETLDVSTPPKGYSLFHISAGLDVLKNLNLNLSVQNLWLFAINCGN